MRVPTPTSRAGRRIYLSLWDLAWALTSPIVAIYLRDAEKLLHSDLTVVLYYWILSSGFALLAFFALRIQDGMTRNFSVHEALDICEAVLFAELMTCGALFTLTRLDGIPRTTPLIHGLVLAAGVLAARVIVRILRSEQTEETEPYRARRERIIVIGANRLASAFVQLLNAYAPNRQSVIAVLDDDAQMVGRAVSGIQVMGAPHELDAIVTEFSIHGITTDRVVISGEADFVSPAVLHEIERVCQRRQIQLCFLPRMIGITETDPAHAAALVSHAEPVSLSFALPSYFRIKRLIDVMFSALLLVALAPLFLFAGILVLIDVGSPILFWQERLGWKKRSFLVYKFRTLRAPFDSDGEQATTTARLPSAIGRFLRATRLDEMPQLLNVLMGDMSLIGPRPLLPEDQPSNVSVRLAVRPGITGWAQVNGAKLLSKDEKEALDEYYIRNASFWMDMRITGSTIGVLFQRRSSSQELSADLRNVKRKDAALEHHIAAE
jgi:lipopolysaccharide/colanic/teichoic acid biosynthesis glycosyltransferase